MRGLSAADRLLRRVRGLLNEPAAADVQYPAVYADPSTILQAARERTVPESPNLKKVFGTTREELRDVARSRKGNIEFQNPKDTARSRGSAAGPRVTTRKNANRLVDVLGEAQADPVLSRNEGWYVMDPAYRRMEELLGPDQARIEYSKMNALSGLVSPRSRVDHEIARGTAARALDKQGRAADFGLLGTEDTPAGFEAVPGSIAGGLHRKYVERYLREGALPGSEPKVPAYMAASGTPEVGFQTNFPIPDSHFARSIGMGEARGTDPLERGKNLSGPEALDVVPWYNRQVAGRLGMEPVSAQALQWNVFAPATGMMSGIGRPKLEILADQIAKTAAREGISLANARDRVLLGSSFAGRADPAALAATAGLGAVGYGLLDD